MYFYMYDLTVLCVFTSDLPANMCPSRRGKKSFTSLLLSSILCTVYWWQWIMWWKVSRKNDFIHLNSLGIHTIILYVIEHNKCRWGGWSSGHNDIQLYYIHACTCAYTHIFPLTIRPSLVYCLFPVPIFSKKKRQAGGDY